MATSFTGEINTNGQYVDLETETGITFTSGKSYSIQIKNLAHFKVDDADFTIFTDDPWTYNAGTGTVTIKTVDPLCIVTILEN